MKKNWDDKGTEVRQTPQKTKNRDVSNPRKGSYKGNSQITKVSMNKNQITSRITRKNEKKLETVKFGAKKKKITSVMNMTYMSAAPRTTARSTTNNVSPVPKKKKNNS